MGPRQGEFDKLPRYFSGAARVVGHPASAVLPNGDAFVPLETWAVSGDIFGCHSGAWWCYWHFLIEAKDDAKHLPTDNTPPGQRRTRP